MEKTNIIELFDWTLLQVEQGNPQIKEYKPYIKAARAVIKSQQKEFEKPKTWEDLLKFVVYIMSMIPQAAPFVFPVQMAGQFIINVLKEQEKQNAGK